jgi:hypothetical protein
MAVYHRNEAAWTTRAQHLDHLVDIAKNARGQVIRGFSHVKLKPDERVYTTTSAALVEERSRSGVPVLVEVCTGTLVVTNTRVVFDGPKNRQWRFDQLQRTDDGPGGNVIMTVTSRKSRSGVRPMGTPSQVEEARTLLQTAILDAGGHRADLVAEIDRRRDAHRRSRPQPPLPPPVPALLRPAPSSPSVGVGG